MFPRGSLIILLAGCLLSACTGRDTFTPVARPAIFTPAPSATITLPPPSQTPGAERGGHTPTPTLATSDQTQTPAQTLTPTPSSASLETGLGPTALGRVENFVEVGHEPLGGRGWNAGLALAYPCAYVGNRRVPQIAIVDVTDPAHPALVGALTPAPSAQPVELRAIPDLGLLVVLNFSSNPTVLTYDVRDCRDPKPLGALGLGAVPHEFFLWRDPAQPARLLMYVAMFDHIQPDLQVVDLSDPAYPRKAATWTAADEGARGTLHSLSVSSDGTRAYLALWEGGFLVADTSDLARNLPDPHVRLVRDASGFAPAPGVNVHSAVRLSDPRYVVLTQEVYDCPFAGLLIADIANESHPHIVGRFDLPENDPACQALPQTDAVFTSHNPLVVASSTGDLVFVTWYGGGLQALDVSNPTQPRRVGLFVPKGEGAARESYIGTYPVQTWSYPILRAGLIYVSDIQSGLYVLQYTGPGAEVVSRVPLAEGNVTVLP
jgi:hypothetical protein